MIKDCVTKPLDFTTTVAAKTTKNDSILNKVMLNPWEGRYYDLEPNSDYNQKNMSVNENLVHVQFKPDFIFTLDHI